LARRDKRFLILFSEGLTREASHHFWMNGTLCKHVKHPAAWQFQSGTAMLRGVFGMQLS